MKMECLCAVVAIHAVLGCAGRVDPLDEGGRVPPPTPSLGVAAQRSSGYGWSIIETLDLNFDGMADVVWSDIERSLMAIWFMNGTQLLAPGPTLRGPGGDGWLGFALDLNADGVGDVLWRHDEQNLMTIWLRDGTQLLLPGTTLRGPSGGSWVIRPNDFDGDRLVDVAWYNAEQNLLTVWLMNGTELLASGPLIPGPGGGRWKIGPPIDFNGDRRADVLWYDDERNLMTVWLMNGTELLAPGPVIPGPIGDGWVVYWAGDFNADRLIDVLWTNEERGLVAVWMMNGPELLAPGPVIPGPIGDGWRAFTAGDVNFDFMADLVWQRTGTSQMTVWLMNGGEPMAPGPMILGPHDGG
ncbi:FG-GAP repeat domain-containing protein [Sorangium sp. So ce1128]